MDSYIPFEKMLEISIVAYVSSLTLLLAASNFCLAVIETLEKYARGKHYHNRTNL
jgi:hypothetical protein